MKKLNLLSKAEMKKVMGGNVSEDEIEDDLAGTCWKCCPDGEPSSSKCSDPSGPGTKPVCSIGKPYKAKCA